MTKKRELPFADKGGLKGAVASRGYMAQSTGTLRIGTRGSALALVQARTVAARLAAAAGLDAAQVEIVVIRTTGDIIQDRPLSEEGGKGLFTKEIEEALLDGRVDFAVHSAKDMPTFSQPGLALTACLEREDPRDVFISRKARTLTELPKGATLGTASLRRQAVAKRARPDLKVATLRGNVETRLRKLDEGQVDATLLALAGLKRLGLEQYATHIMSVQEFLPAVAQGAIGIEAREDDMRVRELLARINHDDTFTAIACERAFLAALDGSCKTPIAGHAVVSGNSVEFRGLIARPDGTAAHDINCTGQRADARKIGDEAGHALKRTAGPDFFD
jgi:hydroxymethylbilane synthase